MTSLNPVYTVGEQIAESVRLHEGLSRRDAMDRAVEMLQAGAASPRPSAASTTTRTSSAAACASA
jgi:ABC-type microcin C transport system duplicated ATPase subunit YejF